MRSTFKILKYRFLGYFLYASVPLLFSVQDAKLQLFKDRDNPDKLKPNKYSFFLSKTLLSRKATFYEP